MPSWPSSLAKKRAESSSRSSNRSSAVRARSSRFVSARAAGAPAVRCTSWARTSPSTSASGTTRSTRPPPAAVSASNTWPVSISRCATCGTIRGSTTAEITAGTMPIRTSEKANVADDPATTTSQAASSPTPPARAGPRTTATTGFGEFQMASSSSGNSRTPWSCAPPPAASARSMPEQKTRPVWSSTTTRTASSASASSSAAFSWARIARESALRLAGESRVSVATPRATVTCTTRSEVTAASCRAGRCGAAHWEQMNTVLPLLPAPGLPAGSPGPDALPADARAGLSSTPFGLYVHVPFCATRCGYCDFNTYTSDELGPGANRVGVRRHRDRRAAPGRRDPGPGPADRLHRLRRRRHPDPAPGRRPRRRPRRDPRPLPGGRRRRGDHRGQPGDGRPRLPRPAARGRVHAGEPRHAVGRRARARPSSTGGTPPAGRSRPRTRPAQPASSTSTST